MRFNVTNRTSEVRSFNADGRFLTLAGGEIERNVELGTDEAEALRATGEFYVTEIGAPPAVGLAEGEYVMPAPRTPKPLESSTTQKT